MTSVNLFGVVLLNIINNKLIYIMDIPDYIKDMARTTLEYNKNEQYEKALPLFNKIIAYSENVNNSDLI
ncbi:MAG: hypothetical protein DRJ05_16805, partial [Bacteroidetes bacterium]